ERAFGALEAHPQRQLALVASRGPAQTGWLGHIFLHLDWFHLLGNLFFLYLVGPLIEDAWGRRWYAGLFLVGGLVASADVLLEATSSVSHMGASGAVAACMGAFTFRFARRRVKMAYFF